MNEQQTAQKVDVRKQLLFLEENPRCHPDTRREIARYAIDLLDQLQRERAQSGWIPCSDGLPTVRETVLATITDGCGNDIMLAWYDGESWQDGYKNKIPVLAWQSLPEPYRGGA